MATDTQVCDTPITYIAGTLGIYPPAIPEFWLKPGELGTDLSGRAAVTRSVAERVIRDYRAGVERHEREQEAWSAHYSAWCAARDKAGAEAYVGEQQNQLRRHLPVNALGRMTRGRAVEAQIADLATDAQDAATAKWLKRHPEPEFTSWAQSEANQDR
jgi:hypothetical protein